MQEVISRRVDGSRYFRFLFLYRLSYSAVEHLLDYVKAFAPEHILRDDTDKHGLFLPVRQFRQLLLPELYHCHVIGFDVRFRRGLVAFFGELFVAGGNAFFWSAVGVCRLSLLQKSKIFYGVFIICHLLVL